MQNNLDIKTLKTIHTLCACGSVTQAAIALGVSPGAISYTINKARKLTGSALFFRTRTGMAPNTLAEELAQTYQAIIQQVDLDSPLALKEKSRFIVSSYSLIELLLSKALLASGNDFPRIDFRPTRESDAERISKLRNKEVDIDIGSRLPVDSSISQLTFFSSDVAVVVRRHHPTIGDIFTMADWSEHQHAIWSRGMYLISDNVEQTNRFTRFAENRDVTFVASSTLNLVMLCANSDLIILLPTLIAKSLEPLLPIKALAYRKSST